MLPNAQLKLTALENVKEVSFDTFLLLHLPGENRLQFWNRTGVAVAGAVIRGRL
jgi:hypothetical protein